jgi:hypothetical protein
LEAAFSAVLEADLEAALEERATDCGGGDPCALAGFADAEDDAPLP